MSPMEGTFCADPELGLFYVGTRGYPAEVVFQDIEIPEFTHRVRRVRLRSEGPLSLSVIWGSETWGSNRDAGYRGLPFTENPALVEAGAGDPEGLLGEPWGYLNTAQVLTLLRALADGTLASLVEQEVPEADPRT